MFYIVFSCAYAYCKSLWIKSVCEMPKFVIVICMISFDLCHNLNIS